MAGRLRSDPHAEDAVPYGPTQFHLRHILLGMLLVSVALAPVHLVLPQGSFDAVPFQAKAVVVFVVVAVSNFLLMTACVWGAFLPARWIFPLLLIGPVLSGIVTLVEFGSLDLALGPAPGEVGKILYLINISKCAAVFGSLLIFRAVGLRLVRARSPGH